MPARFATAWCCPEHHSHRRWYRGGAERGRHAFVYSGCGGPAPSASPEPAGSLPKAAVSRQCAGQRQRAVSRSCIDESLSGPECSRDRRRGPVAAAAGGDGVLFVHIPRPADGEPMQQPEVILNTGVPGYQMNVPQVLGAALLGSVLLIGLAFLFLETKRRHPLVLLLLSGGLFLCGVRAVYSCGLQPVTVAFFAVEALLLGLVATITGGRHETEIAAMWSGAGCCCSFLQFSRSICSGPSFCPSMRPRMSPCGFKSRILSIRTAGSLSAMNLRFWIPTGAFLMLFCHTCPASFLLCLSKLSAFLQRSWPLCILRHGLPASSAAPLPPIFAISCLKSGSPGRSGGCLWGWCCFFRSLPSAPPITTMSPSQ